ncbi:MAG: DJ-1/PfpI family protein [Clostridia bacterium]|nr:DJ-1/PfpI family protein [Clostridia bacterium]
MIYLFLADGFEESEAIIPLDMMRRAGLDVRTVGVTGGTVTSSHGVGIVADMTVDKAVGIPEAVILPGGMPGTKNLEASAGVQAMIDKVNSAGGIVAAICAAPSVLGHRNLLSGRRAVCFPGWEKELYGAVVTEAKAVTDGNIVTARGAGAAFEFGAEIIAAVKDRETADKILAQMQY